MRVSSCVAAALFCVGALAFDADGEYGPIVHERDIASPCTTNGNVVVCTTVATFSFTIPGLDGPSSAAASSTVSSTSTTSSTPAATPTKVSTQAVFAHHLLGVAATYDINAWRDDITKAQAAKIDGFALNVASQDSTTATQLSLAFTAANQLGFKLFISFDYASEGAWSIGAVVNWIKIYGPNTAYYRWNGKPVVSTFEGPNNAGDWNSIKQQVSIFFVPSWSSVGCEQTGNYGMIDGMFSWDSWPVGASNMNTKEDQCWVSHLGGKPFMMGVSPLFYTSLPNYGKNWLWRGDTLWHDRWQQIAQMQPAWVEIISWNDYGEGHYIGPIRGQGIPPGANRYVDNMPHDAMRALLPYYIDTYKYGATIVPNDQIVYWYRLTPSHAGWNGNTAGNAPWQSYVDPTQVVQDIVMIAAVVKAVPATVTIQIGSSQSYSFTATKIGVNMFTQPFNGQTGNVQFAIVRNGQTVASTQGPAITNNSPNGQINFNILAGSS